MFKRNINIISFFSLDIQIIETLNQIDKIKIVQEDYNLKNIDCCLLDKYDIKKIPPNLFSKVLFIAPYSELKYWYKYNFGEYLGDPFSFEDLFYRLTIIIKRNELTKINYFLFTPQENSILNYMLERENHILHFNQISKDLNIKNKQVFSTLLYRIRNKLKEDNSTYIIRTVYNKGFQLINKSRTVNNLWITT